MLTTGEQKHVGDTVGEHVRSVRAVLMAKLSSRRSHCSVPEDARTAGRAGWHGRLGGAWQGRAWARLLSRWTGALVAVGFLLYHALPVRSPLTSPYWGRRDVGLVQWLPALAAIVVGIWCVVAGAARQTGDSA